MKNPSAETILFDLSEVLIRGLIGVEQPLAIKLGLPQDLIIKQLLCDDLYQYFVDDISEDHYLNRVIERNNWSISISFLKTEIRHNFSYKIPHMEGLVHTLSKSHHLVLISDHGREWMSDIQKMHNFLDLFQAQYFSFTTKCLKRTPGTFAYILADAKLDPQHCIFIDDQTTNISMAQSQGLRALHFSDYSQLHQDLSALVATPSSPTKSEPPLSWS